MAAVICQLQSLTSSENCHYSEMLCEEHFRDPLQLWDKHDSKECPTDFNHSLWVDGRNLPHRVHQELNLNRRIAMSDATLYEICAKNSQSEVTSFVGLLRACSKNKDLRRGTQLHDDILKKELLVGCLDALVIMYAKCGAVEKAKELLDTHKTVNLSSWNAVIVGYCRKGRGHDALDCFDRMQYEGIPPNAVTFASVLKACGITGAIDKGKQIHDKILKEGLLRNDVVLGSALVSMYAKCEGLPKARSVLEQLPVRDVVSWSILITGYTQCGQGEDALNCFECMQCEGVLPDAVTYACILNACGSLGALERGKQIHDEIARQGLLRKDIVLGNALVDMYAKCGALEKAHCVLEKLPFRDVVSWNSLIAGYAKHGQGEQAINCLKSMDDEGIPPDAVTYACSLKACASIRAVDKGKQVHDEIERRGLLGSNLVLGNALIDMYGKCGALSKAQSVLEELPRRDAVSWSSLIAEFANHGQGEQALNCLERMQCEGLSPNIITYGCILKACGTIGALSKGKQIHAEIVKQGLLQCDTTMLANSLVDMYAKCGALLSACRVLEELSFWDTICWSLVIAGFAQEGQDEEALNCFACMQTEGIPLDAVTFASALKACGNLGALLKGKQIHEEIRTRQLLQNNLVLGNVLVDMYAKCGALTEAGCVLKELTFRDVVSWNTLIMCYAQHGQCEQALECFKCMRLEAIHPNVITFACLLNMCSHLGLLHEGHTVYMDMGTKYGLEPSFECNTSMINLLVRAGHLEKATGLIQDLPSSEYSAVWHALMVACWRWGHISVGTWAFEQAVQMNKHDGPAYVLMGNIYAVAGF